MPEKKKSKEPPKSWFSELEFVRIIQPDFLKAVPRYLFEQIEEADPEMIDRIYTFGQLALRSPTTLMYGLIDQAKGIKGFLWAYVDVIGGVLFIKILSVDKEYQGGSLKAATGFLIEQIKDSKVTRLECYSMRPKSAEHIGWKKSKQIHLVFEVNQQIESKDKE